MKRNDAECPTCGETFDDRKELREHTVDRHGDD